MGEGIDLNALRDAVKAAGPEGIKKFEQGPSVDERIAELEARINAGMSEKERAEFIEENERTPEKFLENLRFLKTLRETE